jgi:hypothetical protein
VHEKVVRMLNRLCCVREKGAGRNVEQTEHRAIGEEEKGACEEERHRGEKQGFRADGTKGN